MTEMLTLSENDFKAGTIKMFWKPIMNSFETNEKQKVLVKKQKISGKK